MSDILNQNGKKTDKWLFNYPNAVCMLNGKERKRLKNIGEGKDTIIAMCCESGKKNLANIFPEHLIIGGMTDMNDNQVPFGKSAYEIILDTVKDYDYPVCFSFPAGHRVPNLAMVLGREVHLEVGEAGCFLDYIVM